MKTWLQHPYLVFAIRFVVGGLFIYAGSLKMLDPVAFADSIATYQLVPGFLINLVAILLPPLEIVAGLMLIIGYQLRLAAFSLGVLCLVFLVALSQGVARGLEIDCGCFGAGAPSAYAAWWAIGRDLLFLAGIGWIYFLAIRPSSQPPQTA